VFRANNHRPLARKAGARTRLTDRLARISVNQVADSLIGSGECQERRAKTLRPGMVVLVQPG
jgi:hypothetical protein